jgi:hypothetical protein
MMENSKLELGSVGTTSFNHLQDTVPLGPRRVGDRLTVLTTPPYLFLIF